jgi:hypothetical protein
MESGDAVPALFATGLARHCNFPWSQIGSGRFSIRRQRWRDRRENSQVTVKPDLVGQQKPVAALDAGNTTVAGIFDFGPPTGKRRRLFQFATRKGPSSLGPARSEFGCD